MLLERLSEKNKKTFLDLELHLAMADGHFDEIEKKLVDTHCAEMGIDNGFYHTEKTLEQVLKMIKEDYSDSEKKIAYMELISLAMVDEEFTNEEKAFMDKVQEIMDISNQDAGEAKDIMLGLLKYSKELEKFVS